MSVKSALYRYLTDPGDLPGLPAVPFARPRTIAGLTIANRNDARRWLRDRIGSAIYSGRRPMKPSEHSQVYLRTAYTSPAHDMAGAVDGTTELIDVVVVCRKADAAARAETIADLLQLACGGWRGGYWGDTFVGECLMDGRVSRTYSPADSSDDWLHEIAMGFDVMYADQSAAIYPADPLRAVVSYGQDPGIGDEFRVSASSSIIPEGRTLATVQWVIRDGSATGTVLVSISGGANAVVTAPNVGGTYASPAFDRTAFSITGTVHVQLTITDSSGEVATIGEIRNA